MVKIIIHIIIGTWNNIFKRNSKLYKQRFPICKDCENLITFGSKVHICKLCGCVMESKTRVKDEHCEINKW